MCDPTLLRVLLWLTIVTAVVFPIAITFRISRGGRSLIAGAVAVVLSTLAFAVPIGFTLDLHNECADEAVAAFDVNKDGVVDPTEISRIG